MQNQKSRCLLITLYFINGVFSQGYHKQQQLSYRVVNGKVFFDKPTTTTTEASFMETYFPFLPSSYTSSNSDEVDQAIFDSITGPPAPASSDYQTSGQNSGGSGMLSLPSFSSQNMNSNQIQSPYLSSEEDNYLPLGSINSPQYGPSGYPQQQQQYSGVPNQNYIPNSPSPYQGPQPTSYSYQYPPPQGSSLSPAQQSYFESIASSSTESAPFYQPILNFFGFGSSPVDDELSQLPHPSTFLKSLPPNLQYTQFGQAKRSYTVEDFVPSQGYDESENEKNAESKSKEHLPIVNVADKAGDDAGDFPCPKLGNWNWNGEVCIALGPVPTWGCKPDDLVMSGRVGICRNKIFFPPGSNPLTTPLLQ